MRTLPPDLLRSFVAVKQCGSFTAAAERVCLSQSTVSQHVRRLEHLLDRPLFERDTRHVALTPGGEELYRHALKILQLMEAALSALCGPPLSGPVRLALVEDFAAICLTDVLASFSLRHPEVELKISTGISGDLFAEFDEGRHDLIFAKRLAGSARGQVVHRESIHWCVAPDGPDGREPVLPLALHPAPSITRQRVLDALEGAGRAYRIATVSGSIAALQAAAIAGLGICALAAYAIPRDLLRIEGILPDLGHLDYVIECRATASAPAHALASSLRTAAEAL